jgi:hypothetical protein
MRKHLSLGLLATSAILTSGLAFAQSDSALPKQSATDPAIPATAPAATVPTPGTLATPQALGPDGKPIQTEEEKIEMQKRILGVLPNYRTADGTKAFIPLTAKGKIHIALKDSFDYPSYAVGAGLSLIYQAENQNPDFGQGVKGYLHRYATSTSDQIIGNMMTEGFMPALMHEDPRYFRKVTGSFWSRLGYSATRTLVGKDDHGKDIPNFSEVIGNGIGAAIGNAYYPHSRTGGDILQRTYTAIGTDTISNILKEFWPDVKNYYHQKHLEKLAAQP